MAYRAVVVGCGLIGSEFSDTVIVPGVWSHAAAYVGCPGIDLVAVCDHHALRLARCAQRWQVPLQYHDFRAMLDGAQPEIVSICTPDATHAAIIREALAHGAVRAVLAEKPLAITLAQADELMALAITHGKVLVVNYSRRFAPGFVRLQALIADGALGDIRSVSGFYTKGVLHNGSHWFDLARFLVGAVTRVTGINRLGEVGDDPTLDVMLEFAGGASGYLHACAASDYAIFEMDIVGTLGRARMIDSGFSIELYEVSASPFGAGYLRLVLREIFEGGLGRALPEAVASIVGSLRYGRPPRCSADDGRQAMAIGLAALESARSGLPAYL
jgi:predicted dehydrogenase